MIFDIYFTVFIRREKKSVDFILKSAKAFFFITNIIWLWIYSTFQKLIWFSLVLNCFLLAFSDYCSCQLCLPRRKLLKRVELKNEDTVLDNLKCFDIFFVLHTCLYIVFVIVVQDNVSRIKLGSLKSCSYSRLAIMEYKFSLTSRCTRYVLVNINTVPRVCVHFVLSDRQRGDEIVHQGAPTTNNISFDRRVGRNLLFVTTKCDICISLN